MLYYILDNIERPCMHPEILHIAISALDKGVPESFTAYDKNAPVVWRELNPEQFGRFLEEFSKQVVARRRFLKPVEPKVADHLYDSLFEVG